MRKKYRDLKRKGNVIVFPTTINRLLTDGMNYLKNENYEEARDKLYQVLSYEPENAAALGAYAYSLFELGDYEEALDVCRELLKVGPIHYLETMELYISILMQVREYKEAEQMIEILIEEKVLPEERLEQFRQLRDLNERIVSNAPIEKVAASSYALDHFLTLAPVDQERLIMNLPLASYKPMKNYLIKIVEHPNVDLLTKTYILFMLHQEKVAGTVHIQKFHFEGSFSIAALPDPINNKRLNKVKQHLENALLQDPTRLEMVLEVFERHIYLLYPFQWEDYEPLEVAEAYLSYLELLFTGEETFSGDENLTNLIITAEQWFEWRNG
ncbi:tetratricopeptide repeat protein [Planococcus shixiaomingii]|uniref:tetratricopeptide repeat protein n=1 Tax=Planococcus shixiaomingii TaxID=3058393 RepID=UPI0026115C88|nr:tetratricopeptide repeat protein [Planococcus sp. N022]WKA56222.1 tetratricopeptide repeat protein [Planococcus sp. N022]